jgi:DNA repair protein RecO (recombination protein O)
MNRILTTGIILGRIDYGEADRILTVLTPEQGKLRLMAKGVRRIKSKLAGGIELFSVSQISFIPGKGDIGTLVSTRLEKHYDGIVAHLDRVQLGYELLKLVDKVTEDVPEAGYFQLLQHAFEALADPAVDIELVRVWFFAQLLRIAGHTPNMQTDNSGKRLDAAAHYEFDQDNMSFVQHPKALLGADSIKFLRLLFSDNTPQVLSRIAGHQALLARLSPLVHAMRLNHLRS